jgi:hypothetical protein
MLKRYSLRSRTPGLLQLLEHPIQAGAILAGLRANLMLDAQEQGQRRYQTRSQ